MLAHELAIDPNYKSIPMLLAEIRYKLQANTPWLLVFDNVTYYHRLKGLLLIPGGTIICTARVYEPELASLSVSNYKIEEARAYIERMLKSYPQSGHAHLLNDDKVHSEGVNDLIKATSGHPASLRTAMLYINNLGIPLSEFLKNQHLDNCFSNVNYINNQTFYDDNYLSQDGINVLSYCAYLNSQAIPIKYLIKLVGDEAITYAAISELRRYNILTEDKYDGITLYQMNPLIQNGIRRYLNNDHSFFREVMGIFNDRTINIPHPIWIENIKAFIATVEELAAYQGQGSIADITINIPGYTSYRADIYNLLLTLVDSYYYKEKYSSLTLNSARKLLDIAIHNCFDDFNNMEFKYRLIKTLYNLCSAELDQFLWNLEKPDVNDVHKRFRQLLSEIDTNNMNNHLGSIPNHIADANDKFWLRFNAYYNYAKFLKKIHANAATAFKNILELIELFVAVPTPTTDNDINRLNYQHKLFDAVKNLTANGMDSKRVNSLYADLIIVLAQTAYLGNGLSSNNKYKYLTNIHTIISTEITRIKKEIANAATQNKPGLKSHRQVLEKYNLTVLHLCVKALYEQYADNNLRDSIRKKNWKAILLEFELIKPLADRYFKKYVIKGPNARYADSARIYYKIAKKINQCLQEYRASHHHFYNRRFYKDNTWLNYYAMAITAIQRALKIYELAYTLPEEPVYQKALNLFSAIMKQLDFDLSSKLESLSPNPYTRDTLNKKINLYLGLLNANAKDAKSRHEVARLLTVSNSEEALYHYNILCQDKTDYDAYFERAHFLHKLKHYDEAIRDYEYYLRAYPGNSDAKKWLEKAKNDNATQFELTSRLYGRRKERFITLFKEELVIQANHYADIYNKIDQRPDRKTRALNVLEALANLVPNFKGAAPIGESGISFELDSNARDAVKELIQHKLAHYTAAVSYKVTKISVIADKLIQASNELSIEISDNYEPIINKLTENGVKQFATIAVSRMLNYIGSGKSNTTLPIGEQLKLGLVKGLNVLKPEHKIRNHIYERTKTVEINQKISIPKLGSYKTTKNTNAAKLIKSAAIFSNSGFFHTPAKMKYKNIRFGTDDEALRLDFNQASLGAIRRDTTG
jgi:hypothetical protein